MRRGVCVSSVFVTILLTLNDDCSAATPSPTPANGAVGTAFAPTTPGGQCLDTYDYNIWITPNAAGLNGFDLFPTDLQLCAANFCGSLAFSPESGPYDCGGAFENSCPDDIFGICVRDCMAHQPVATAQPTFPALQISPPFSLACASCMGNVSYCATQSCFDPCFLGGSSSDACKACNVQFCNPAFEVCAGLNIDQAQPSPNYGAIAVGAALGGSGLLLAVSIIGYRYRQKTRKLAMLNPSEMEQLAKIQSLQTFLEDQDSHRGEEKNEKVLSVNSSQPPFYQGGHSSFMSSNSKGTRQAQQQQQQQVKPTAATVARAATTAYSDPARPMKSDRVNTLVSQSSATVSLLNENNKGTPLVMLWDFKGQNSEELTVRAGDRLIGLATEDGWWLAMTDAKRVGLVPANYTTVNSVVPKKSTLMMTTTTRRISPSGRMSKMHASIINTPFAQILSMPTTQLLVVHDFEALRPDEITVSAGTMVLGIHEEDGWWLVRNASGSRIGLIPSNFLDNVMMSSTLPSTRKNNTMPKDDPNEPDF